MKYEEKKYKKNLFFFKKKNLKNIIFFTDTVKKISKIYNCATSARKHNFI
jgi:hypothetical protein